MAVMKGIIGLLILVLTNQLEGSDDVCAAEIRIPRHTITSAVENSPMTLHCPVKHCGWRPQVTWCKLWNFTDCITVNATDNIKIQWKYSETEPSISTSELIFTRVSMGDAGLYRCGIHGNVTSVSHNINVSVKENVGQCTVEILKQWNMVILAVEKSSVTLNCPVKHCGETPTLTWCKITTTPYCMIVKETDNIKIERKRDKTDPDISTSRLIFKDISMEDAGLYRCNVFGSVLPVIHHINITVTVLPRYGPRSELVAVLDSQLHTSIRLKQNQLHSSGQKCKYTFVSEDCWWSRAAGASLTMSCRVELEKPPTVTWCKQEGGLCIPLEDKDKYSLIWLQPNPAWGVSYLTVYNIGAADSGEYHCHASPASPCVTGDVLSSPIRLLVSGDVVKECGRDATGPLTVGILNIVQIVEITVLLGSFAAFNVYWRLKLSETRQFLSDPKTLNAYPKGRSSPVKVTEDDTSGGDPIQAETENDTELDYDNCATV